MGNSDNWTTPKQIKIMREESRRMTGGSERLFLRGPLKKGERRKGVKARLDELNSSKKNLELYAEWIRDHQKRREQVPGMSFWDGWHEKSFDRQLVKHTKLLRAAMKDGIIEDVFDWWVFKP